MIDRSIEIHWVSDAIKGDRNALDQLIQYYRPILITALSNQIPFSLRNYVNVEDIIQDVCVSAVRNIKGFQYLGDDSFYRWLFTIAKNRIVDLIKERLRTKRGGTRAKQIHLTEADQTATQLLDRLTFDTQTPSRGAATREAIEALQLAILQLKPDYQQVIVLRYIQDKSVSEVAAKMNRSDGAIHLLAHRAVARLRELMGEAEKFLSWKS